VHHRIPHTHPHPAHFLTHFFQFRLLGDGGLPLRPQFLTIVERGAGAGLSDKWTYYNLHVSNGRVLVEQAFGITKQRWRIFLGKTGVTYRDGFGMTRDQKYILAWRVACILHNVAVTHLSMDRDDQEFEHELETDAERVRLEELAERMAQRASEVASAPDKFPTDPTTASALEAGKVRREEVCEALWRARS